MIMIILRNGMYSIGISPPTLNGAYFYIIDKVGAVTKASVVTIIYAECTHNLFESNLISHGDTVLYAVTSFSIIMH